MTNTLDIDLFWISFWLYLGAFVMFSIHAPIRKRPAGLLAVVLFFAGLAFHTAGLAARWVITSHPPFSTMYEYAVTMSWVAALGYVFILARFRKLVLGIVVTPLVVAVLAIASMFPKEASRQLMPALQSYWFYIHVSLAALSEGVFIIAAGAGVLRLAVGGRESRGTLPSRELLDELISRSLRIGYPLFTVGALFAGSIWAHYAWGAFWSWDPKETGSLVIWLFYTLLLHQNVRGRWEGRTLAIMSIVGFLIFLVSFLGNFIFEGMHAYI